MMKRDDPLRYGWSGTAVSVSRIDGPHQVIRNTHPHQVRKKGAISRKQRDREIARGRCTCCEGAPKRGKEGLGAQRKRGMGGGGAGQRDGYTCDCGG